jgi:phosphoribosyl 1,2-cyclic phosphodiesterase
MSLFCQVLASGSKGNAVLVCSPRTRILVDAGLSGKELAHRLDRTPVRPQQLDGLVISHEHQDHVRGAGVMSRRFDLPVYLTCGSLDNLPDKVGRFCSSQVFQPGVAFEIGDLRIHPFAVSHDAGEPVGFVIEHEGFRLGICTDLGIATQLVRARLQKCNCLVLEANHDLDMLLKGPYPWELKQRIRSRHGHLSNADTSELLKDLHHDNLKAVVFAHLSETNNHPDIVHITYQEFLRLPEWESVRFEIGKQYEVTPGIELT